MAKKEKDVKEKKQKNTSYFKEMKTELKKVVWPTPKELLNNTIAVIAFVLIIAIIVFILDLCFDNLNKYGITRLQERVQSSFNITEDESNVVDEKTENNEENENNNAELDAVVENNDETNTEESNTDETTSNSEDTNSSENNEDTATE